MGCSAGRVRGLVVGQVRHTVGACEVCARGTASWDEHAQEIKEHG